MSHTSSTCKLRPGAAIQGKVSQRSAEHGGSSEEPVNLPRDAKGVTVWFEQFWLNIFSFLRQLQCCSQRPFGHNFDRFPVANLHQLQYFLAPVFERTSVCVEQVRKAIKRAWRSSMCERFGAALNFPTDDLETMTSSSKSYATLSPHLSAFSRRFSICPAKPQHYPLQRSLSSAVGYWVIPRADNRKMGRICDREGKGGKTNRNQ